MDPLLTAMDAISREFLATNERAAQGADGEHGTAASLAVRSLGEEGAAECERVSVCA